MSLLKQILIITLAIIVDRVPKLFFLDDYNIISILDTSILKVRFAKSVNEFFAFSLPSHPDFILVVVITAFVLVLLYWISLLRNNSENILPVTLVVGGAIGNLADRFIYGGVIDWFEIMIFNFSWLSFNIADIIIISGIILMLKSNNLKTNV